MSTANDALNDECEALNSIYGNDTIIVSNDAAAATTTAATLRFPNQPFSFRLEFPSDYPDVPLQIVGTQSTGNTAKGAGEAAVLKLHEVFGNIYTPGQVCLFDLVEEAGPGLDEIATIYSQQHGEAEDAAKDAAARSAAVRQQQEQSLTVDPAASLPAPKWTTTEAFTVNKSVFVGRALPVVSMDEVTNAISHLLATNKRVATATHNIKAWRIKDQKSNAGLVQDYDDDGESAAGGRMLHLMQLMDVYGLVVVTRWYGGVKLGPDRFRVINNVAREALTLGGFVPDEKAKLKK